MKTTEIDLGMKLASAFAKMAAVKSSNDLLIYVILREVRPHQLSVEDLEKITSLDRGTIAPVISALAKIGYVQEKGGLVSVP